MNKGFTIIESIVSLAIFSIILLAVLSFIFWMSYSNSRTKADRETLENARRAIDIITSETKRSKSIYAPTTSANQLSLETANYLPADEIITYIDFFLCGSVICLKKESMQQPVALTSDSVEVTNLVFSQIVTNGKPSVKIDLTINCNNSSVSLTSTASPRSY